MKIYVASAYTERVEVAEFLKRLRELGHVITHDWTDSNKPSTWEPNTEPHFARTCSTMDMNGVLECDMLILMGEQDSSTGGCYGELGGAIMMSLLMGQGMFRDDCGIKFPKEIVVIRGRGKRHIFYYHPLVLHLDSCNDAISYIDYIEFKNTEGGRLK